MWMMGTSNSSLDDFDVLGHQHEDRADVAVLLGVVEFSNFFEVAFHKVQYVS